MDKEDNTKDDEVKENGEEIQNNEAAEATGNNEEVEDEKVEGSRETTGEMPMKDDTSLQEGNQVKASETKEVQQVQMKEQKKTDVEKEKEGMEMQEMNAAEFMSQGRKKEKMPFKKFLCNREKGECLGRSCCSWIKILIFYILSYVVLGAFMAACMITMMTTLRDDRPKWSLETETNILKQPGMNTLPPVPKVGKSSAIRPRLIFSVSSAATYSDHVDKIAKLLKYYYLNSSVEIQDKCGKDATHTCNRPVDQLGPCNGSDANYGYDSGEPCVALRVNKVHNWKPSIAAENPNTKVIENFSPDSIPVSCEEEVKKGESPKLSENVSSHFQFFPSTGFVGSCFPFCGHKTKIPSFISPVVMVKLVDFPKEKTIFVWCKMYLTDVEKYHTSPDTNSAARFEVTIGK